MDIAIPLFDRFTALDAIGPYEVLSRIPDSTVHFLGADGPGPKRTENEMLTVLADRPLSSLPEPDVVLIPGGVGNRDLLEDEALLDWVRHAHETSRWTTSVCTGALVLGAAGILDGLRATTHWLSLPVLERYGATPSEDRIVREGKVVTAAGVSAGIDMALHLTALAAGPQYAQGIQLGIEYDPMPPFDSGSPAKAPAEIVELVRERAALLA